MISEKAGRFDARLILTAIPKDTIEIEIAPRGKSRLTGGICDFVGLMLHFSDSFEGSVFEDQVALPVVTHCKDRESYEDLVFLEYLAYRIYNAVTDMSLRVRLARVEYFDSEQQERLTDRYGFFLENWDDLAERNGYERLTVPMVPPSEYEDSSRTLFEIFQYLIGNTDWSYALPAPDESSCCHNTVPVGNYDYTGPVFPIPYDFDQAGLVDAPYSTVDPSLPIRNVRERLFRGICGPVDQLNAALFRFESRKQEIQSLIDIELLMRDRARDWAKWYIEDFYRIIADERRVSSEFLDRCRTP
jgi:hypothetical protein